MSRNAPQFRAQAEEITSQGFPAIAEANEVHEIETIWGPRSFTRWQGGALHPEREPLETLQPSGGRSASTTLPDSISNRRHRWAAAWSKRNGSSARHRTLARRNVEGQGGRGGPE
jgi:hypothetical protein